MFKFSSLSLLRFSPTKKGSIFPNKISKLVLLPTHQNGVCNVRFNSDWNLHKNSTYKDYSISITSYFKLPEQGMKEYEVLSRSSCFFTPAGKDFGKKYHIFGSAHVTHPWLYRKLYRGPRYDWLNFVYEEAVKNTIAFRDPETGKIIGPEFNIGSKLYRHPSLDLVNFHLEDEEEFMQYVKKTKIPFKILELETRGLQRNDEVILVGHDFIVNEKAEEVLFPVHLNGKVLDFDIDSQFPEIVQRGYIKTPIPSVNGMCGGPILDPNTMKALGMIEALVLVNMQSLSGTDQLAETLKALDQTTTYISSQYIKELIQMVEGGESLDQLGGSHFPEE